MLAAVNLGLLYLDGKGTPVNYAEALKWTQIAADSGQMIGLNNMGHLYEEGLGVPVDKELAVSYYQQVGGPGLSSGRRQPGAVARLEGTGKTKRK